MTSSIYYLLCCLASLACVQLTSSMAAARQDSQQFLEQTSFGITTKITLITPESVQYTHEVNEKYSAEQQRAKIQIKSTREHLSEVVEFARETYLYFVDRKSNKIILSLDEETNKCVQVDEKSLGASITLSAIEGLSSLRSPDSHIIGTAQLLIIVARNRDRLKLTSSKSTVDVRSIESYEYKLDLTEDGIPETHIYVFFNKNDDPTDARTNPIRVIYSDDTTFLMFDFSPVKLLQPDSYRSPLLLRGRANAGQTVLDEFAINPLAGCSDQLKESSSVDLFGSLIAPVRFSFVANVRHQVFRRTQSTDEASTRDGLAENRNDAKSRYYTTSVAYDESLQSLRVDTSAEADSAGGASKLLYNFPTNRVYKLAASANNEGKDCIIGEIKSSRAQQQQQQKMSLSQLLTGASSWFIYLGRARVRGINTLLYELVAYDNLPFWLDPPAAQHEPTVAGRTTIGKQAQLKASAGKANKRANSVLYHFAEHSPSEKPILVMMEIYQHQQESASSQILSQQTINIFDFKWDLEPITPAIDGVRLSELFTLKDSCLDGSSPMAFVELLIEQRESSTDALSWMSIAALRNQALLAGISETLRLSSASVFDLESRLINESSSMDTKKSARLMIVDFWYVNHPLDVKKLVYYGLGHLKTYSQDSYIEQMSVSSFRECFMLAAAFGEDIYFAFDRAEFKCLLDRGTVSSRGLEQVTEANSFTVMGEGQLEIYKCYKGLASLGSVSTYWLSGDDNLAQRTQFVGKQMKLAYNETTDPRLTYTIERIHVKRSKTGQQPIEQPANGVSGPTGARPVDEIRGYGLRANGVDVNNKLIEPTELHSSQLDPYATGGDEGQAQSGHELFEMTPEHCRSRCLADPQCQSYSVCLINYHFQCIVSSASFKSPDIIRQLEPFVDSRSGRTISVDIGESVTVELIKRASCTLYNKQFVDLFKQVEMAVQGPLDVDLSAFEAVRSRDECAARCARRNFELSRQLVGNSKTHFHDLLVKKDIDIDKSQGIDTEWGWKRILKDELCDNFMYLSSFDVNNLAEEDDDARQHLKSRSGPLNEDEIDGFCQVRNRNKEEEEEHLEEGRGRDGSMRKRMMGVEYYAFDLINLYEGHHGIGLVASELSQSELNALEAVRSNEYPSARELQLVGSLIKQGKNLQLTGGYGGRSECARACFLQHRNPWPACHSFDLILERGQNNGSSLRCRFNSATLKQVVAAGRHQLIETNNKTNAQIWHFEPLFGGILNSANFEMDLLKNSATGNSSSGGRHLTLVVVVALMALASGLWLGVAIHRKYLNQLKLTIPSRRSNSNQDLVIRHNDGNGDDYQYELDDNQQTP